jgi:WD40 repeat protein
VYTMSPSTDDTYIAVQCVMQSKTCSSLHSRDHIDPSRLDHSQKEVQIPNVNLFIFNSAIVDAIKFTYKEPFEPLFEKGTHAGSIINVAITPSKTIMGSLSDDKTFKIWNFQGEQKQQFSCQFKETEYAFDIHPLAIQCAVGFKEGLKVFYILEKELKLDRFVSK